MKRTVETIPVLNDNWVYLIESPSTGHCLLIDAGEAAPVLKALGKRKLEHTLLTHHHADHIHGAEALQKQTGCMLHGAAHGLQDLPKGTKALPDSWHWEEYSFDILKAPGHTLNHIMFYEKNNHWLFSGDTLFIAGCGRLFEGSPDQMFESLQQIKSLPDDTQLYCGHNYTLASLTFAKHLFPEDLDIIDAYEQAQKGTFPTSTTLGLEKRINPFLRAKTLEDFTKFRTMKDKF